MWGKQQQAVQPLTASRGMKLCEIGRGVSPIGVFEMDTGAKDTAARIHQWRSTRLVLVDPWNPSGALWCHFIQAGGCTSHQNCPPGGEFQAKTPQDFSHPAGRGHPHPSEGTLVRLASDPGLCHGLLRRGVSVRRVTEMLCLCPRNKSLWPPTHG